MLPSCKDDFFKPDSLIGEGTSMLTAQVVFSDVVNNLSGPNTRTPGNAINQVESLCVIMYDEDGKLLRRVPQADLINLEYEQNTITSPDAVDSNEHQAEDITPKASFSIPDIPYGKYYIYAVANMGDLAEYDDDAIATPTLLKRIRLNWDPADVPSNNQMFGYFTTIDNQTSQGFDAPLLTVNKINMQLHAWLKRAASKVTVAVDGSQLYDDVKVWIKSIQVKDIPAMCWLGQNNTASANTIINQGEKIVVSAVPYGQELDDDDNLVTKTQTYPAVISSAHTQTANALFFYENMQGEGQLKSQVWPSQTDKSEPRFPDGNDPESDGYKDSQLSGTYIEVLGYYKNSEGEGPIIYRFMLGKNITRNYDAQRNYHFKLTLQLKNNANDNDWHIVYNQDPDIIVPSPYYISYLYNQSMDYPFKIVGGELTDLWVEIPNNDLTQGSWHPKDGEVTKEDVAAAKSVGGEVYWTGTVDNPGPWNGFLAVQKTTETVYGTVAEGYTSGNDKTYSLNYDHFYGANKNGYDLSERHYNVTPAPNKDNPWFHEDPAGDYTIEETSPGEWSIIVPLFTRARVMTAQTGYTGNNPYVAYQRESEVIFHATIRKPNGDEVTIDKPVRVIQARRIVNPKAIWREAGSMEEFHVQLKIRKYQTAPKFENLLSDGPWKAEVTVGKDWVEIIPTSGASQMNPDGTISGIGNPYDEDNIGGRSIDFTYKPKSTTTTPRGGIITIHYNNFSCVHTIFVRQGYDPVEFYNSGTFWHTYNLRTGGVNSSEDGICEEAVAPEVEGSYFRKYNRWYPIDARSNTVLDPYKIENGMTKEFEIAGPQGTIVQKLKWSDIKRKDNVDDWGNFIVKLKGQNVNCRIPTIDDASVIIDNSNTVYGYGVIYTDGASQTQEDVEKAYGANPGDYTHGLGMRGVIVCDQETGTQLFFPLAASGYGRFKQQNPYSADVYNRLPSLWGGVVQYSNRYTWWDNPTKQPLFYDLYSSQGTLYWLKDGDALDINYYTLDFALIPQDYNTGVGLIWSGTGQWAGDPSGTDAVHIRLVHDRQ